MNGDFQWCSISPTLSCFEGTAPHVIQTLYVAPMIIAALFDLFCIQNHGRGPSDSPALPLERDRLLDLLRGQVKADSPGKFSR
jgi:hypothetical protein